MSHKLKISCLGNRAFAFFACIPFILSSLFPVASAQKPTKLHRLAVISAYHESAPWVQDFLAEVTVSLSDRNDLWIDPCYMNATLITDKDIWERTTDGVFQHFKNKKPDYLLLFGGMTLNLLDRVVKEWGDIPIVLVSKTDILGPIEYYFTSEVTLCSSDQLRSVKTILKKYNITFIQYPDLYERTVDMMVEMQPNLKKIIMLADASYNNRHIAIETQAYISDKYPDIQYEWLISKDENASRVQSYLTRHEPEIGLLLCSWFYGRMSTLGYPEILSGDVSLISAVKQPVFTLRESYLHDGAVGGHFPDFKQVSKAIVEAVNKIIDSVPAQQIPSLFTSDLNSFPIVNYQQMENTQLSQEICPADTVFINRPESFWKKYKWHTIIGILGLFCAIILIVFRIKLQQRQIKFFRRYNVLLNNMPIAYTQATVLFDQDGKVIDIAYHSSNQSFIKILAENAQPSNPDKIFPPSFIAAHISSLLQDHLPHVFNYHFKGTDHYYSFVLCLARQETNLNQKLPDNPEVDLFAIDVTDRSHAEINLRKLTDKLELTLNLARIIPWYWDLNKHEITCDTHSIARNINMHNHHRSKFNTSIVIRDEEFFARIHPDDKEKIQDLYKQLVEQKVQYVRTELRIYPTQDNHSDKIEWLEINAVVTGKDGNNQSMAISGSLLVISKRKKQEQALIAAREQAQESDRMKSAFLANMSHEIRTPLNAIVGFSGLLSKTEDPEKKRKYADLIESNNNLLLQLISDVLDLAKVESNTLEFFYQAVDLNELMNNIEQSIRFKVKENVALKCTLGAAKCVLNTDPNRLSQVINNLLTNACKFTTQGSIEFGYEVQDSKLYFYVKDTGIGISFENQSKLFQRFSKLNTFAQGTGLGLSICKGIVESMGGCIGVVSTGEGKGSKFWFSIPYVSTQQPVKAKNKTSFIPTEIGPDSTILIAEDNESNYMLFQSILESEYKLIHAWDGVEAVKLFKEHKPQLILMDIGMPHMDGYEATKEIRKISSDVPIIAVTAFAFASDKEKILANGFEGYIAKPINADYLINELAAILGKKPSC